MGILNRISELFRGYNWLIIPAAFLSIVIHEISHGYAAYAMGDKTAKSSGRLSLNPVRHFDPIGIMCMVLFGFGWARPVPVNAYYFKNRKLGMSITALAGPVSNILMAFLALVLLLLLLYIPVQGGILVSILSLISNFLYIFALLNVGLAVFNLIPIPPLDGSKVLFSILPHRMYGYFLRYEQFGMLILIVLINVPFFSNILMYLREGLFDAVFTAASVIVL